MTDTLAALLRAFDRGVFVYFLSLNTIYLLLIVTAVVEFSRQRRRQALTGQDATFANPLTPGVSILIPAHDEEAVIVDSVRSMLSLRYPCFEVIVVDDGSTDETFARLAAAFDLREVPVVPDGPIPVAGPVHSVHAPASGEPLLVVRKASVGRRADALNAALNIARHPLVCMVDADALLEEDALLRVVTPFVDDPDRVIGVGGVVRAANGCRIEHSRVVMPRLARSWLVRIQVVEYLRAFLLGRTGWSKLGALLVISGAFGVFRRDLVVAVGGLDRTSLGEDAELVTRLHRSMREQGRDYRMVFVSEPVCWTEVPSTPSVLARQRRRWSQGLAEVLHQHRRMIGNPRYGRVGLGALPYFLVFELLTPLVELAGLAAVATGLALGLVDPSAAWLFAAAALGYGLLVSLASIAAEVFSHRRYVRWRDLHSLLCAAVIENVGFRQVHAWWRLQGLVRAVRGTSSEWGVMTRTGFDQAPA